MSVNEDETSSTELLTTEFRDGQLQIVEVTPFEMGETSQEETEDGEADQMKFMQVVDPSGKELMQLDLLNFTLVRCEDGEESYKLVANSELQEVTEGETSELSDLDNIPTVTCVLQSSDGEEQDGGEMSESYVMLEGEQLEQDQDSYVMLEGEQGPIVFLQSELNLTNNSKKVAPDTGGKRVAPTTLELLEKAKAVNKAKKLLKALEAPGPRGRGRPRKYQFPEPNEILSSPNFKLFLYSCRLCNFRCNATKELTEHKEKVHSNWAVKYRTAYRGVATSAARRGRLLQCGGCPFRALTHAELTNHVKKTHPDKITMWTEAVPNQEDVVLVGRSKSPWQEEHEDRIVTEDEEAAILIKDELK